MGDIRVIVKRPNEIYGHTVNISNDLKTFQGIVEGYIETITICNNPRVIMVVNDEEDQRPPGELHDRVMGKRHHPRDGHPVRSGRRRVCRCSDRHDDMEADACTMGELRDGEKKKAV